VHDILVIDNYDSFTFNLVELLRNLDCGTIRVVRNDKFELALADQFQKILLSPGPGLPSEAGLMPKLVKNFAAKKSILGICLGHQCIGELFGARLFNLPEVLHGKGSKTIVTDATEGLFKDLPAEFIAGRYHSWVLDRTSIPECLKVTAVDTKDEIMAIAHRQYDLKGVQFHPESILTGVGPEIIRNWVNNS